jgi:PAS domain S-box-containing protein
MKPENSSGKRKMSKNQYGHVNKEMSIGDTASVEFKSMFITKTHNIYDLFGFRPDELKGVSVGVLFPEYQEENKPSIEHLSELLAYIKNDTPVSKELEFQHRYGQIFKEKVKITPTDNDTYTLEFLINQPGISDQMLENMLSENPALAEFIHRTPMLIRMSNEMNQFYYFSKHWLNFTGAKLKDELNEGWLNHVYLDDSHKVENSLQKAFKSKSKFNLSYRLIRKDGQIRWIYESGIPIFDNDGTFIGHLVVSLDFSGTTNGEWGEFLYASHTADFDTDDKNSNDAIRKSNQQLMNLFDSANDLIQIVSPEGKFLFVNKTWKKKLGYSDDEIPNLKFRDILDSSILDTTLTKISEISAENEEIKIDTVLRTKKGDKVFVTGNLNCSFHNGSKKECRGIFYDVTERLKAEKEQNLYYSISNLAFNSADLDALFIEIHNELQKIVNADNFYVALCDENKTHIHFPYLKDEKSKNLDRISERAFGNGLTEYAITNQKPVFYKEKDLIELEEKEKITIHGSIPKVWLGVPLKQGGNIIGIIVVQSYTNRKAYTRKDLDLLVFISSQIATAIDRQQKQEKIRDQAARLQSIFNSGSHMIWSVNKSLEFSSYNQNFFDFLQSNFMTDSKFKKPPDNINEINTSKFWKEKYNRAFAGKSEQFELKFKSYQSNQDSWKNIFLSPIFLEDQVIEEVSGIAYDITDNKLSEIALKRSEEEFRDIFDSFQDVYFRCSFDGELIMLSPSIKELLGYEAKDLTGKDITNYYLYSKKSRDLLQDLIKKRSVRDFEAALVHKNGSIKQCLCNLRLVYDNNIKSIALEGVARDITKLKETNIELKQAKEVAERSLKVKELFLANMSHEIRTPMNGIIGMIDLMEGTTITPEQKHYIKTIKKSSETLLNILNDILDLSKIEAGKMQLKKAPVKLRNTMDKIYALFAQQALTKNINLYYHLSEKLSEYVLIDETRLLQILSNLISNAIKFTEGGGSIDIDLKKARIPGQKNMIRCVVSDSGIGISPENIRRLFGIFSQIDNTTTKSYGGTGLGLAISKELARLMGGKIGVYSTLGLGSSFWFTFEAEPTKKTVIIDNKIVDNDIQIEGYFEDEKPAILLVDDNGVNRQVAGEILRKSGCIVTLVENGKKAIELVASNNYDLVFMDIQMPEMDGVTATKKIKAMKLETQPPIVAMTAYSMKEDKERFLSQGLDDYIAKPIRANDLLNKVRQWVLDEQVFNSHGEDENHMVEVLNMDTVNQLIDLGGEEMVHQVFDDFMAETTEQIESSLEVVEVSNFEEIRRHLHTLKGNAGTLGVEKLSKLAELIEKNIKNENYENLEEDLKLLNLTFEEFKNMFNQILNKPKDERP